MAIRAGEVCNLYIFISCLSNLHLLLEFYKEITNYCLSKLFYNVLSKGY